MGRGQSCRRERRPERSLLILATPRESPVERMTHAHPTGRWQPRPEAASCLPHPGPGWIRGKVSPIPRWGWGWGGKDGS